MVHILYAAICRVPSSIKNNTCLAKNIENPVRMRPSVVRLVRVIQRRALSGELREIIIPAPVPQTEELKRHNLIDILTQQKAEAGVNWPTNIRLEPVVKKEAYRHVQADVRVRLKKLLKER